MTSYNRAPIIDAILQLQFPDPLTDRELERVAKKAKYDEHQEMIDYNVEIKVHNNSATPGIQATKKWHRMSSRDGADSFSVQRDSITVARSAPYPGWGKFFERFCRDYDSTKSIIGNRRISRIGLRYINRIDAPTIKGKLPDVSAYLNIYPRLPHLAIGDVRASNVRFEYHDPKTELISLVTSGTAEPVLLNHDSYFLDIDIIKSKDIAVKIEDVLEQITHMRQAKNEMFESCITDRTRELINA